MGAIADAIFEYAQPLIDQTDGSLEQLNKSLSLSQSCWNMAILPEEERREVLDNMRPSGELTETDFDLFERGLLQPMIRRHEEMFPGLHGPQPFATSDWDEFPPRAPAQRLPKANPPVGRYDPCPCNSGKKYKFCCGRRRG